MNPNYNNYFQLKTDFKLLEQDYIRQVDYHEKLRGLIIQIDNNVSYCYDKIQSDKIPPTSITEREDLNDEQLILDGLLLQRNQIYPLLFQANRQLQETQADYDLRRLQILNILPTNSIMSSRKYKKYGVNLDKILSELMDTQEIKQELDNFDDTRIRYSNILIAASYPYESLTLFSYGYNINQKLYVLHTRLFEWVIKNCEGKIEITSFRGDFNCDININFELLEDKTAFWLFWENDQ